MEKDGLINYLQDVYQLEINRKIIRNSLQELKNEFRKQEADLAYVNKEHKVGNERLRATMLNFIISLLFAGVCVYFYTVYFPEKNSYYESKVASYSNADLSLLPEDFSGILWNPSTEESDALMLHSALNSLEEIRRGQKLVGLASLITIIWFGGSCVGILVANKKRKDEQEEVDALSLVIKKGAEKSLEILRESSNVLKTAEKRTENSLEQLYSLDIIYPKYRYLEACGTFLEYLLSGRANALEATAGFVGAYTLFEEELFRGEINNKLDRILQNQKILIRGQKEILDKTNAILNGVNRICRECSEVKKEINRISRIEEINAFYNSVTAYNTTVTRRIMENYY